METLGTFLLRSGVLNKDTLAAALDRQVVFGGWLDTALLELGLMAEPQMAELLARWCGYPACQPGWLESVAPGAAAGLVPASLAVSSVVVPFAESAEGIWVAVPAPVDTEGLSQLAAALARPVLPHVGTELRIRQALQRLYGARTDPRFDELAASAAGRPETEASAAPAAEPALPADAAVTAVPTAASQTPEPVPLPTPQVFAADVIHPGAAPPASPQAAPAPPPDGPPMDFAEALAHLAGAQDRDGIVDVTLRYTLQTFRFAAFMGVLRGQVVVWAARSRGGATAEEDALHGLTLPLAGPSLLRTVVETRAPLLTKPSQSAGGQALVGALGRSPRALLLQPILVSGRVVGVLYADDGPSSIKTRQASLVLAFASRIGPAFEALIRERRSRQMAAPAEPPPPEEPAPTLSMDVVAQAVDDAPSPTPQQAAPVDDEPVSHQDPVPTEVVAPQLPATPDAPSGETGLDQDPPPVDGGGTDSADDDDDDDGPRPGEEPIQLAADTVEELRPPDPVPVEGAADDPPGWDGVPASQEPVLADTQVLFHTAPLSAAPPADSPQDAGQDGGVELEVDTSGESVGPSLDRLSPEAAALAAVALAHAQAGDDDEDDEPNAPGEAALSTDIDWNEAMGAALQSADADGRFEDRSEAGWDSHVHTAAHQAGTLEGPAATYIPLPEDDEDDEAGRGDEEGVVFAEVENAEDANAEAFTQALEDAVSAGHQGGEVLEEGYRAFSATSPMDDDEVADMTWEDVVAEAAAQASTAPPPLPAAAAMPPLPADVGEAQPAPPPLPPAANGVPPPLPPHQEPAPLIDPPKVWVEALTSGVPDRVAAAREKLTELGELAVPALTAAFPGRVSHDPFGPEAQTPDPSTLSPLLDMLVRLGNVGLQVAVPHLDSRYPAFRYFSTLLLARTFHPASIPFLLRRLHDDEPRIRKLAGDALASYVAEPGFEQVLRHLRTRIHSVTPEGRRRAIHFLGRFRDVGSVPALMGALRAKESEIVQEAAGALHAITLQPWGTSERKWVGWWEKNKARSRIEWLIDALRDSDVEVRARAGAELAQLTRDTFGFRADGPRREREAAVKKWERWWGEQRQRAT